MTIKIVKSRKVTLSARSVSDADNPPDKPESAPRLKRVHSIYPWEVSHHEHYSAIRAYVEITGEIEIIAVMQGINHVAVAEFITSLANAHNQKFSQLQTMPNWEAEISYAKSR